MNGKHKLLVVLWAGIVLAGAGCSLSLFRESPADGSTGDDAGEAGDVPAETPAETTTDAEDGGGGADGDGEADGDGDVPEDAGPICGNGVVDPSEECDDGAENSDTRPDACRTNCLRAHCGDGVVDSAEGCDDGDDTDPLDGCHECVPASCGNGVVDPSEECDDGNDDDTDACLHTCRQATCGDGFIRAGVEECDTPESRSCTTPCGSTGSQACVSCQWAACAAPAEACNGADDDCDTTTDEGYTCIRGVDVSCTTECSTSGIGRCTDSCTLPDGAACIPPDETCNGRDDDCDGDTDEVFDCRQGATVPCTTTCDSAGTGICTVTCEIPPATSCTPPAETCNGADDDCDGPIDEDFPCVRGATVSCTTSCDSTGTGTCTDACQIPLPADCTPPGEACGNGRDDDCDGSTDEGSLCAPGSTVSCRTVCDSAGTGTCTDTCQIPLPADCTPPTETCNGVDDDCVSGCDNGWPCCSGTTVPCPTTCGSVGTGTCTTSCAVPTGSACTPPPETCNGRDDDCDGGCDNGFACCQSSTGTCTSSCGTVGSRTCSSSCTWGACTPPAETCNGHDDDCDTSCDEGWACCAGDVRYCSHSCGSTPTAGTQTCRGDCAVWLTCTGECCNGVDDDSDTLVDEGVWCPINPAPPVSVTFNDVFAVRDTNVWVVGSGGTVLQWSGSGWTNRSDAGFTGTLRGVWSLSSPTTVVVVGDRGALRTWNGSTWTTPTVTPALDTNETLYDVQGWASNSIAAIGGRASYPFHATVVGFDGTTWRSATFGSVRLRGLWGYRNNDLWGVGLGGQIWHWDGTRWVESDSGTTYDLYAVHGTGSSAVRAVGAGGRETTYSGFRWTASSVGVTTSALYGYYARSATEAWAVGASGTIVRRDGSVWKLYAPSPTSYDLYSVHSAGNVIFAVGAGGTVLTYRVP
ncbi:MAG: hypothetical protein GYA57_06875 [Myxococcales bacterium]|nr:hypothetical protein [Myxococcales bacterium]